MRIPVYERQQNISPLSMPAQQVLPQVSDNGESASKTLAETFARLQKFTDDFEDTQTLEAFNKFKLDSQQYHEDPDKGIYHTRIGGKSFGIYHDADEWLRHKGEDYARELPSDRAKRNFRKMAREHIHQRGLQNSRFEAGEMRKYRQETADAAIRNALIFAERHWDNLQSVEQARTDIAQALELKMRGSSTDAFKHAMSEIEDQIGLARIRQAFAIHPLLGLNIFNDRDNTHLKPETRAKMLEYLKGRTEIYRMQGYIEEYARQFNPKQAEALRNILVSRLGADEGQKAFTAVSHYWSIQETQKRARKQAELEQQQHNEDIYLKKRANPERNPISLQQIRDDVLHNKISPQFGLSLIARIEAEQKQAEAEQRKKDKAAADLEMFRRENTREYFTNEELEQGIKIGAYTDEEARRHRDARETYARRREQEQKQAETDRLQKAKDDFLSKFYSGSLTLEDIDYAKDNNILAPNDAISLRNMLQNELERKERAQAKADKEKATELAKADKQARKNELNQIGKNFAILYPPGKEQEAYKAIDEMKLDVDEDNYIRQQYNGYIQEAKTAKKNSDDEIKAARQEFVSGWEAQIITEVNTSEQIKETREAIDQAFTVDKSIQREDRNRLMSVLDEKKRNFKQITEGKEDADNKDIATDYFNRYGLDGIHEARQELRELYSDPNKIKGINYWLNQYEQQAREQQNDEAKALREQQEQTFIDLRNQYWRQGKTVPVEDLSQLEKARGLTPEQVQRAYGINSAIRTKKGMEAELMQNPNIDWDNLSPTQREALVMQRMGTDENKRRENVAYLIGKVLDGSSSDWEITEYETSGRIAGADVDTIKNFDSKFDRARKEQIRNVRREMEDMIKDLHNNKSKDYGAVLRDALIRFDNLTSQLDPRATDFEESLKERLQDAMQDVLKNFEKTKDLTSGWWIWKGLSAAGERYQATAQKLDEYLVPAITQMGLLPYLSPEGQTQTISPTGETLPYDNSAPAIPPAPTPTPAPAPEPSLIQQTKDFVSTRAAENVNRDYMQYSDEIGALQLQGLRADDSNSLRGMSDVTKSILDGTTFRVTSPFSYTRTALRNERAHLATDLAVPVGTPVHTPQYGGLWTVVQTGENSTAGKFIKIQSTLDSGDVHEYTYAHLDSWGFQEGDTVSQGDIVAQSGNTGHSTGPHLHVALKVNGKPVDPTKVNINGGAAMRSGPTIERAQYFPQPIEEIQRMTDEQAYNDFSELIRVFFSNDIPRDISTAIPYGANFGGDYY